MIHAAWLTDVHLNFLLEEERAAFFQTVVACSADAVLISGDIAEGSDIGVRLVEMAKAIQRPLYLVLGNHDCYRSSIEATRERVAEVAASSEWLTYLTSAGVVPLTDKTALVGHDGWGDARYGDFFGSQVRLNDFEYIEELRAASKMPWDFDWDGLHPVLQHLGDQAGEHLERVLDEAMKRFRRIIVLTHVPPFAEAATRNGHRDEDWLPFSACKATGDVLRRAATSHPEIEFRILCGHTHSAKDITIGKNIRVWVGEAEYCEPAVQQVFPVDEF